MRKQRYTGLSRRSPKGKGGFTLIEMAVVLVILSMAAGGGLAIFSRSKDADALRTTRERMEKILRMTELYVLRYGQLPCPASPILRPGDSLFGQSISVVTAAAPGTPACSTSATYSLATTGATTYVFMGAVPVGALGLHPDYMLDGWGRQLSYVVDQDMTNDTDEATPFFNGVSSDISIVDAGGNSVVKDGTGTAATPAVLVLSHGRNGFGAFPYKANSLTVRKNDSRAVNTRTMEEDNAHCSNAVGTACLSSYTPSLDVTFRQLPLKELTGTGAADTSPSTNLAADITRRLDQQFDDILMWRTKWDLDKATNR